MDTSFLFAWPESLPDHASVQLSTSSRIQILLRAQLFQRAEQLLIAVGATAESLSAVEQLLLRLCLFIWRGQMTAATEVLTLLDAQSHLTHAEQALFRYLTVQLCSQRSDYSQLPGPDSPWWYCLPSWQPLRVAHSFALLTIGDLDRSQSILDSIGEPWILEACRIQSLLYARRRDYDAAINCLAPAVQRFPQHRDLCAQFVNTLLEARSQNLVLPSLRHALSVHGEDPALLGAVCTVKLLQRQPSLARRAAFIQRLSPQVAKQDAARLSNVLVTYEQTGHSDWLSHLSRSALREASGQLPIQENRCLQLASAQSPLVADQVRSVVKAYQSTPIALPFSEARSNSSSVKHRLRIGWVTGDVCHHPVTRFLLGFFEASLHRLHHQHVLVNLRDHLAESYIDRFQRYPELQHVDASIESPASKVDVIRDAQLDVAIDLSGWTGGHFMRGFMARLAPLQVNYLGYFATTGLPTMDAWIGDAGLFPNPMQEWHSEQIHRLPRCFIAWQPSQQLDEAHESVTDAPTGGIRFGCFNHNRKLSDTVLRLWGDLLNSVPGSSLVLKANASADPYTQTLLVRRMRRAGLDPQRVIWLPLAGTHREHLQQYRHVDVALDSFPNGGCTTSCEALWMGVPVITLTGTHYVSRMSTAVLQGAGMADWCANTPQHYVSLAKQQADRLAELRQNRDRWRAQVMHHPLGDAADLMHHLEQAFVELHSTALMAQASR